MSNQVDELLEKVKRLPVADKLRLAAELVTAQKFDLAEAIALLAHDELVARRFSGIEF